MRKYLIILLLLVAAFVVHEHWAQRSQSSWVYARSGSVVVNLDGVRYAFGASDNNDIKAVVDGGAPFLWRGDAQECTDKWNEYISGKIYCKREDIIVIKNNSGRILVWNTGDNMDMREIKKIPVSLTSDWLVVLSGDILETIPAPKKGVIDASSRANKSLQRWVEKQNVRYHRNSDGLLLMDNTLKQHQRDE